MIQGCIIYSYMDVSIVPLWAKPTKALYIGDREMSELEKAKKKYWYDHSFDKSQNHWDAYVELSIFAEGWKQALEWVLTKASEDTFGNLHHWEDIGADHKIIAVSDIKEELNATSEKRC